VNAAGELRDEKDHVLKEIRLVTGIGNVVEGHLNLI